MSSVTVITTIIVLLAGLVCYAFISQTIRHKREQRSRLLAALKSRSRNFKFMLSGFPAGFLSKELTLLVHRSLIEVCEQLSKLDPNNPAHVQDLQTISSQMAEVQRQAKPQQNAELESHQQIKEVKACLEELNRFLYSLERQGRCNKASADSYRNQIKQLVLKVTVSSYELNGRAAAQASKTKLASHYYTTALNLLVREGRAGQFDQKIKSFKEIIAKLEKQLEAEGPTSDIAPEEAAEQAGIDGEWDKFSSDDDNSPWKKKQVYD